MPELGIDELSLPHLHPHTNAKQSSSIFSHQQHSCTSANILCWPWCLASQCMPLRATSQCAVGTTKANNPSVLPLGMVFTYSISIFIVKLFLMWYNAWPSSESECSPVHLLSNASLFCRETSLLVHIHFQQAANNSSSPCTSAQLVTCMGANLRVQACNSSLRQSGST